MKLIIGSKLIALPVDAKISIERSTPLLNDDTGSFSFPFPVPTLPNQQNLGWPGKLTRDGDIPVQSFVLEESGLQVFRGEIDYDDVTSKEIGLILKSGFSEFMKKIDGERLGDLDYGWEWWPAGYVDYVASPSMADKLAEWDIANTTDNGKYIVAPFMISDYVVNNQDWSGPGETHLSHNGIAWWPDGDGGFVEGSAVWNGYGVYCLQFRITFILRTIFEKSGYVIVEDMFSTSVFNKAVVYGKIMSIFSRGLSKLSLEFEPLNYWMLMPDILIIDFLNLIKSLFCLFYEIDEHKKEVHIKFKKDIFLPENLDGMKINELQGWTHKEVVAAKGFTLKYSKQDNDLDTFTDYPDFVDVVSTLPTPTIENKIVRLTSVNRDYIAVLNSGGDLEWKEVGRLKQCLAGEGENTTELNVMVPAQKQLVTHSITLECPYIPNVSKGPAPELYSTAKQLISLPFTVTNYHGRKAFGAVDFPYASFDRFSMDGLIDVEMSLKPAYLYETVYSEFLNWQTYRARGFTKYIEITLLQLIQLQWGKRYMIGGSVVILDKIKYDMPYKGVVEVDGFTG